MTETKAQQGIEERVEKLAGTAKIIRSKIVKMVHKAQSGHPGGALSSADFVTALYFDIMNVRPKEPHWPDRDRFIMSKGHACPVWYACLAVKGYFDMSHLDTLRQFESILQGHPDMKKTPGVDMTTGSLGQGLSMGLGMALEGKMLKKDYNVFVIVGDGELQEGQIWEASIAAARYKTDNLIAIVDNNRLQMDGFTKDIMPMDSIDSKFRAFNWDVYSIDGHNMKEIVETLDKAVNDKNGRPKCIVASTIKGKGVSYMENVKIWHGKAPNDAELEKALAEINGGAV